MKKRIVDLRTQEPLLDIVSYGRGGRALTQEAREHVARTVRRVPEVIVKVSGGARTLAGVERHLDYIGRSGELEVEGDGGERVQKERFEQDLVYDWDLDLEARQRQTERSIRGIRKPPKLVHNLVFSMPAGTPPKALLRAVRKFAIEEFALKHRYLMVLHTDDPHPHVHMVVKAVSEQGTRLNIRKATLREWRKRFAERLREQGVAANATERAVRGRPSASLRDGIYRAHLRGESIRLNRHIGETRPMNLGDVSSIHRVRLIETNDAVKKGWGQLEQRLMDDGDIYLAQDVRRFVERMGAVHTDQELALHELRTRVHERRHERVR